MAHTVRVRTEVEALARDFDYTVPPGWSHDIRIGTRVRVPLHGRTVRGWVVDDDADPPAGVGLLPAKSWLGWGPPPAVVELARWAAWRWAGPEAFFLGVASPPTIVRALRSARDVPRVPKDVGPGLDLDLDLVRSGPLLVRLPPATDLIDLVLAVVDDPTVRAREGSTVVLVPSVGWAERLRARLERRGCPVGGAWEEARAGWPVVVGSRAGAWSPVPRLAAAVVLDGHDAAYVEERAPTYHALDVVVERARREAAPCVVVSPTPPLTLMAEPTVHTSALGSHAERAGWPTLELVDRRGADPRTGLFSEEFVRLARAVLSGRSSVAPRRLVCVYNRKGGARLLACAHCGELARCTRCGAAMGRTGGGEEDETLGCPRCGDTRPVVCASCGRLRMKTLRAGVSRLRAELAALLGVEVGEVTGPATAGDEPSPPDTAVVIGTEAVLHRERHAAAVAFLDIDLHLLAPRLSATEETLALLVRAGRLVGARGTTPTARVLVQTRVPRHPVLDAAARGEPGPMLEDELELRRAAGLPPFTALALVSGARVPEYAEGLRRATDGVSVEGPVTVTSLGDGRTLVRAPGHGPLCDLLARTPRPQGRGLRVEVDPVSI